MSMSINRSGGDSPWGNVSITLHLAPPGAAPGGQFAPPGGQPGAQFQNPFDNNLFSDDLLDHDSTPPSLQDTPKSTEPVNAPKDPLQALAEGGLLPQLLQIAFLLGFLKRNEKPDPAEDSGNQVNQRPPSQPESRGRFDTPPQDWDRVGGTDKSSKNSGGQRPADDPQWTQPSTDKTSTEKEKGSSKGDKSPSTDKEKSATDKDKSVFDKDKSVSDKEKPSTTKPVDSPADTGKTGKVGPTSMPAPTGEVTVNQTIVVKAGEVFDGGGKLYKGGSGLGDGGQAEGQKPIFKIEPGGSVQNLQYAGADGIHTYGDATIKDVWARDVGEDAMTMKAPGNVKWSGGGAFDANDKIFQLNAGGSFTLENFVADGFGKGVRTNGGKQIDTDITIRNSEFRNGDEAIVRTDSLSTRIKLEGVTFSNVPNDVLAPEGTSVTGAVNRGSKAFTG